MDIPVMPLRAEKGRVLSSDLVLRGTSVTMSDAAPYDPSAAADTDDKNVPLIVIDVKGLQRGDIDANILKRTKIKRELWLMTGIRDAGDVMDAFQGCMSKMIIPYHLTSDRSLKDITDVSDCCIPSLFIDNGAVHSGGNKKGLTEVIRTLRDMNFGKVLAFDVSDKKDISWKDLSGVSDILIPYVPSGLPEDTGPLHDIGFSDTAVPAVRPSRDVF